MDNRTSHDETARVDFGDNDHEDQRQSVETQHLDVEAQQVKGHGSISKKAAHALHKFGSPREHDHEHNRSHSPSNQKQIDRTDTGLSRASLKSVRQRHRGATQTVYGAEEMGRTTGWEPGLEPGVDTSDPPPYRHEDTEHHDVRHLEQLHQQCEITVVDYSSDQLNTVYLDNDNLKDFLEQPQEDWAQVRWINCNGLSWDVIKTIGNHKRFHRLAVEDLMNTRNRTKADWYHDHTYVVLPLQKLVNIEAGHGELDSEDDSDGPRLDRDTYGSDMKESDLEIKSNDSKAAHERKRQERAVKRMKSHKGAIKSLIQDVFGTKKQKRPHVSRHHHISKSSSFKNSTKVSTPYVPKSFHTHSLQQYHAGPNKDRIDYMQRHSALGRKGLGVSVEQVSIFLTADNTVVSFFEYSAPHVENPIMRRLQSKSTILRQSCDASMLLQSILDTIIDLAIEVTTAYQDAIGDVELAVLTDPDIGESTSLYILTSEVATLRSAIAPVAQLIVSLREHKSTALALARTAAPSVAAAASQAQKSSKDVRPTMPPPFSPTQRSQIISTGVTISELTKTYLADVEDHAILIQDAYDQMRRNADNLVDLIFNMVSAYQNESMKQLTIVTCFFLPLTFLTGYFGMNFHVFSAVDNNSDVYFWAIAIPVCVVVAIALLWVWIERIVLRWANKQLIKRGRKRRLQRGGTS